VHVALSAVVRRDQGSVAATVGETAEAGFYPGKIKDHAPCTGRPPVVERGVCLPKAECGSYQTESPVWDYWDLHRLRKEQDGAGTTPPASPPSYDGYSDRFPPKAIGSLLDGCNRGSICCSADFLEYEQRKQKESAQRRQAAAEEAERAKRQRAEEAEAREAVREKAREEQARQDAENAKNREERDRKCKAGKVTSCRNECWSELEEPCKVAKAKRERRAFVAKCKRDARQEAFAVTGGANKTGTELFEFLKDRFDGNAQDAREVIDECTAKQRRLEAQCIAAGKESEHNCNTNEDCPPCYQKHYTGQRVASGIQCAEPATCSERCVYGDCANFSGKCVCSGPGWCDF